MRAVSIKLIIKSHLSSEKFSMVATFWIPATFIKISTLQIFRPQNLPQFYNLHVSKDLLEYVALKRVECSFNVFIYIHHHYI